jgi:hypothetical protein
LAGISTKRVLVASWSAGGWGDTVKVNQYPVAKYGVSVAAERDGALHVAWAGNDSSSPSYNQVQYRTKPAVGAWQTQQHLTQGANSSRERVSLAATNGLVQAVWSDQPAPSQPFTVRLRRYEQLHDVGVKRIVQPAGTVDSGAVVQPAAWVKNYGDVGESSVPVRFSFGSYARSDTLPSLVPSETAWVGFDSVAVVVRGWNVASCSTSLAGDANTGNDAWRDSFFVRVRDVSADSIISPADTVYDPVLTPRVCVRNLGNAEAAAVVHVWISGDSAIYHDSVVGLFPPGSALTDSFQPWPTEPGIFTCRCSVAYTSDVHPDNDTLSRQFRVVVSDVGVTSIIAPTDTVDSGQSVAPRAIVHNFGRAPSTFDVVLRIGVADSSMTQVDALGPDSSEEVTFDAWSPRKRGRLAVWCSTRLAGDCDSTNDVLDESVFVRVCDASPVEILCPAGIISSGEVRPRVRVANRGNVAAAVPALFRILKDSVEIYCDSLVVALGPDASIDTGFSRWQALSGTYVAACSTALVGDMRPDNDNLSCGFRVESLESRRWKELKPVPLGPWRRPVKDGGCLAVVEDGLLALKGANTREFFRYSETMDSWTVLADMPPGDSGRRVKAGAALCWDGNTAVYALKGNNTREFWRYDIAADSWCRLVGIPEYTTRVRLSSGLVFLPATDSDKVFMVKGGNCREFLAYWVGQDEWHSRRSLPAGRDSTRARHGTCLALLGDRIFCLKGGTCEFYEYFPNGDSWRERARLPRLGRSNHRRKPGKGAALASDGSRFLYASKGGSGNEFWRYDVSADSWTQLDDVPAGSRRRKVGRGGALAWYGGRVYALKGGGSTQFWSFDPLAVLSTYPQPGRDASVEAAAVPLPANQRAPGLLRCGRSTAYPVPEGTRTILVIDAAGRVVSRSAAVRPFTGLRFSRPGVFFVVMAGDSGSSATKSMVVR